MTMSANGGRFTRTALATGAAAVRPVVEFRPPDFPTSAY
jgi:hypothetical protein